MPSLRASPGRTGDVAREIVGVDSLRYVGQHGLELEPAAAAWADRVHAFAREWPWPWQEAKPLTAAYHFRLAPDENGGEDRARGGRRRRRRRPACGRAGGGWCSRCSRRSTRPKGTAVRHLLEESGLQRALYAGDDTTDLDGFARARPSTGSTP